MKKQTNTEFTELSLCFTHTNLSWYIGVVINYSSTQTNFSVQESE